MGNVFEEPSSSKPPAAGTSTGPDNGSAQGGNENTANIAGAAMTAAGTNPTPPIHQTSINTSTTQRTIKIETGTGSAAATGSLQEGNGLICLNNQVNQSSHPINQEFEMPMGQVIPGQPVPPSTLIQQHFIHQNPAIGAAILAIPNSITPAAPASTSKPDQWAVMLNHLIAYKAQHNNTTVPKRYKEKPSLGVWVETQRAQFKKMWIASGQGDDLLSSAPDPTIYVTPNTRLNAERLRRLQDVGFSWFVRKRRGVGTSASAKRKAEGGDTSMSEGSEHKRHRRKDVQWNEMYQRLVQFKNDNGNCIVPKGFSADPKLACWVETQRHLFSKHYSQSEPEPSGAAAAAAAAGTVDTDQEDGQVEVPLHQSNMDGFQMNDQPADQVATAINVPLIEHMNVSQPPSPATEVANDIQDGGQQNGQSLASDDPSSASAATLDSHTTQAVLNTQAVLRSIQDAVTLSIVTEESAQAAVVQDVAMVDTDFGLGIVNTNPANDSEFSSDQFETPKLAGANVTEEADKIVEKTDIKRNVRLTADRKEKLDVIGFVWSLRNKKNAEHWEVMFNALREYKTTNGNCLVPSRYSENTRLAKWVENIRSEYAKLGTVVEPSSGLRQTVPSLKLTADRIKRLEDVGFEWRVKGKPKVEPNRTAVLNNDAVAEAGQISKTDNSKPKPKATSKKLNHDKQWDMMFSHLAQYKEGFGHTNVPKRYKENPSLGVWCDTQRVQYKKLQQKIAKGDINAKSTRLTEDRMQRLNGIGFVWSIRHDWQKHYNELLEFKAINGHCNVPARYLPNNRLGIWVTSQRQQFKNLNLVKSGKIKKRPIPLTEEKIKLLENVGFEWTLRTPEATWKKRLEELQQFKLNYGANCMVPSKFKDNPRLGLFAKTQRAQRILFDQGKPSTLNQKKIADLDALGFCWIASESILEESVEHPMVPQQIQQGTDETVLNAFHLNPEVIAGVNTIDPNNTFYASMPDANGNLVAETLAQTHASHNEHDHLANGGEQHHEIRPSAEAVYDLIAIPNVEETYAIVNAELPVAPDIASDVKTDVVNDDQEVGETGSADQQGDTLDHHQQDTGEKNETMVSV